MTMGSRIVVMKDGFIQQVDSPQELYDHPVNLFVAGFIGSPQMNFIPVKLVKEGDDVFAMTQNEKIKIPEGKVRKFKDFGAYVGQEVIMGIRPEDFHDEEIFIQNAQDSTVKAYIDVVELLGSETFLYMNIDGVNCIAKVDPRSTARAGDTIKIALDTNRLHFFDKETEETLLTR
jgi:multiple sugar transport system ATP-binding protein